jgi:Leucine-rich repeat (LRR) protein
MEGERRYPTTNGGRVHHHCQTVPRSDAAMRAGPSRLSCCRWLAALLAMFAPRGVAPVHGSPLGACAHLLSGGSAPWGQVLEECGGACVPIGRCSEFPSACRNLPLGVGFAGGTLRGCWGSCVPVGACEPCAAISSGKLMECAGVCVPRTDGCASCGGVCACEPGTYLPPGGIACLACGAGSSTNTLSAPGATLCLPAPSGTYDHDSSPITAPILCGPGYSTDTLFTGGAQQCIIVLPGMYDGDKNSRTPPTECNNGSTTDTLALPGATQCTPAPVNYYDDDGNATTPPVHCPAGYTTACDGCVGWTTGDPGATNCVPVPPGMYDHDQRSMSAPLTCLPGSTTNTLAAPMATACVPAPVGWYDHDANSTTPAVVCGGGNSTNTLHLAGASECTPAPPGTHDHDSDSSTAPVTGLGYIACRDREVIVRNEHQLSLLARSSMETVEKCSFLSDMFEDCGGACVPKGRRCVCKQATCQAALSCSAGTLGLGGRFEHCGTSCVPQGQCGVCNVIAGGNLEACRGHCVPRGQCNTAPAGAACKFCPHCPLEMSITLQMAIETVYANFSSFATRFKEDVGIICGIQSARVAIVDVRAGSVQVTFQILGSTHPVSVTPGEALAILQTSVAAGQTVAAAPVQGLSVLADPAVAAGTAPTVPCPVYSRGGGDGAQCQCLPGYIGQIAWIAQTSQYSGTCKKLVPCAVPSDYSGQFDISDCVGVAAGGTCIVRCAAGGVGVSTTWACSGQNTNASTLPVGRYPAKCEATWNRTSAYEKAQLLRLKPLLGYPIATSTWHDATDPCVGRWPGVGCGYLSGLIERLDLRRLSLPSVTASSTSIPRVLGLGLRNLLHLNLARNRFDGTLPFELGFYPRKLRTLDLSRNNLVGTIHPYMKFLTQLEELDLAHNKMGGPISFQLTTLVSLKKLDITGNSFEGALEVLLGTKTCSNGGNDTSQSACELTGNIYTPATIATCKNFLGADVGDPSAQQTCVTGPNRYFTPGSQHSCSNGGSVVALCEAADPAHASNCATVNTYAALMNSTACSSMTVSGAQVCTYKSSKDVCELTFNTYTPPSHTKLEYVYASKNKLTGMPRAWGDHTNLTELDLSYNEMIGTIPTALANCVQLRKLILHGNKLSGTIPSGLALLPRLSYLQLSGNKLTGSIPSVWDSLSPLTYLDLAGNRGITGTIPLALGNLQQLRRLNLYDLALSGTVPEALSNLTQLKRLYLRENLITGTLPSNLLGCTPGVHGSSGVPYPIDENGTIRAACLLDTTLGWVDCSVTGATTCRETDGCRDDPCFPGVKCHDVPAPGAGFTCDPCPSGYTGNGIECQDIDDCLGDYSGPCGMTAPICTTDIIAHQQICANVPAAANAQGSAACLATGVCTYTPSTHAGKCTDAGPNVYTCDCIAFHTFAGGRTCETVMPCSKAELNACHPQANCHHLGPGSYLCICKNGWMGPAGFGSIEGTCSGGGDSRSLAACELTGATFTPAKVATCSNGGDASSISACTLTGNAFSGTWSGNYACTTGNTFSPATCTNGGMATATCSNNGDTSSQAACERTGYTFASTVCTNGGPTSSKTACEQSGNAYTAASCSSGAGSATTQAACELTGNTFRSARQNCEDGDASSPVACELTGNSFAIILGFRTCTNGGDASSQTTCERTGNVYTPGVAFIGTPARCATGNTFAPATCTTSNGLTASTCIATNPAVASDVTACNSVAQLNNSTACDAVGVCVYNRWRGDTTSRAACEDGNKTSQAACEQTGNVYVPAVVATCTNISTPLAGPTSSKDACERTGRTFTAPGTVCIDAKPCDTTPCFTGVAMPAGTSVASTCTDISPYCKPNDDAKVAAVFASAGAYLQSFGISTCDQVVALATNISASGGASGLSCNPNSDQFFSERGHGRLRDICPIACGVCTREASLATDATGGPGYICGPCPSGFSGDGTTCVDINDCVDPVTGANPCGAGRCTDLGANTFQCVYTTGRRALFQR